MNTQVIYINLERSIIRNKKMIEALEKLNCKYVKIDAIDANNINKNQLKQGVINDYIYKIKDNVIVKPREKEIAIILSHIKALNYICENNIEIAIVMEDDISFQYVYDWNKQINDIINNAPKDWKILKLHTSAPLEVENNINLLNKNIYFTQLTYSAIHSAGCYIIKKSTSEELLKKYCINNIYTFPSKQEYVVCECIIFSTSDIYMYTVPFICVVDNNVTCAGNHNIADESTNKVIHKYWKNIGVEKNKIFESIYPHEKPQRHKIITLREKMQQK